MTEVAPWRLERRVLSGPRISGTCAKTGRLRAESLILKHLLGRVRDVVGAADDVREAHVDVVGDDAQVIRRNAIGAQEDEVLNFGVGEFDPAKDGIVEACGSALRERRSARRTASPAALRSAATAGSIASAAAVVHRRASGGDGCGAALLQFFFGAEAGIGVARWREASAAVSR